jgi:aminomethyltransferase
MRSLQIGQLRYGAFCDDEGRMLGDGIAFRYDEQHYGAVTALPGDGEALLEAAGGAEFELRNVTARTPHLQLQGPESRDVLRALTDAPVEALGYYRFLPEPVAVGGVPARIARCGYSGELGYELYTEPAHATALWNALLETERVRPYGLDAVETLRVESGLIALGAEFDPGVTDPFEVNLERVVRLDKPEFRGRAALIERALRPGRRLVTLLLGEEVPQPGAAVRSRGDAVGEVRSAVIGPSVGRALALAAVDVAVITPGARFQVELGRGWIESECRPEPAYDPSRSRVRA